MKRFLLELVAKTMLGPEERQFRRLHLVEMAFSSEKFASATLGTRLAMLDSPHRIATEDCAVTEELQFWRPPDPGWVKGFSTAGGLLLHNGWCPLDPGGCSAGTDMHGFRVSPDGEG